MSVTGSCKKWCLEVYVGEITVNPRLKGVKIVAIGKTSVSRPNRISILQTKYEGHGDDSFLCT